MLDFGDCRVADTYENRLSVAQLIRRHQPKIILAPYWQGGHGKRQGHPDHLATGQIAIYAANYATFKKLPIDEQPHTIKAMFHYFRHYRRQIRTGLRDRRTDEDR